MCQRRTGIVGIEENIVSVRVPHVLKHIFENRCDKAP